MKIKNIARKAISDTQRFSLLAAAISIESDIWN
jgi:hypothetical protein